MNFCDNLPKSTFSDFGEGIVLPTDSIFSTIWFTTMTARIRRIERIPPHHHVTIIIEHTTRIRHNRIRTDEDPQQRVIVPRLIVEQPTGIHLLTGKRLICRDRSAAALGAPSTGSGQAPA